MTENHKKALEKLLSIHSSNDKNIALIICGSIARNEARDDSDIDLYLVVTDDEFRRVVASKDYFYGTWDPDDFYGIEIDGKIIGIDFLENAVMNADEPTRASFQNAYPLFSKNANINDLIKKIAVYPDWEHKKKTRTFYSYVKHYRYIGESAFKKNNEFLFKDCILKLVLFSGRLVLAHNHVLFPCVKSLFKALNKCKEIPDNFIEKSVELYKNMEFDRMIDYYESVITYFKVYEFPDKERIGLILEDEMAWYTKEMPVIGW